uniref:Uncharacterized protein n=1 Tax=Candidatus Kentrum sp. LFY TaxID=2126342 RepID=A0A450WWI9_9GAMM|nr:MAG: hypothetical protein BECKLFY1418C_GA0070996_10926 [Candidatus Kentron sp. LFY]
MAWNGWAYYLAWTGETPWDALDIAKDALSEAKKINHPSEHMVKDTLGFATFIDVLKNTYYLQEKNKQLRKAKRLFESARRESEQYPFANAIYKLHLRAVKEALGEYGK